MKARDVMTIGVFSVTGETTIADAAYLMNKNHISALPVIDAKGHLLGIVSEGDLLRRVELGSQRTRSPWTTLLGGTDLLAKDYVQAHASKVKDVMTKDVVTVGPDATMDEIATLLETKHIKRVPVVHRKKVIGIVTRANLVRALACAKPAFPPITEADEKVRLEIAARASKERWAMAHGGHVLVKNGVVQLWGLAMSQQEMDAFRVLVEGVPGVRKIVDNRVLMPLTILPI